MSDVQQLLERLKGRWDVVKQKLGIRDGLIVIDFVYRESEEGLNPRIDLIGSDMKRIYNATPTFVEELAEKVPAIVSNLSGEPHIESVELAQLLGDDSPLTPLEGVAKIAGSGKLYLDVGNVRYFFNETRSAERLKRILLRNRLKELQVELIALTLEDEDGGRILGFTADWDKINARARDKRQKIDEILQARDASSPERPLAWEDMNEKQRIAFAKHYLKLAMLREGSFISLLDENLQHSPLAFYIVKPESSRKFQRIFNAQLIRDFLKELGIETERPISAQTLESRILAKFQELREAYEDIVIEAALDYLGTGRYVFDEKTGEYKLRGHVRVPECVPVLLKNLPDLTEKELQLLAHYIKHYARGFPLPTKLQELGESTWDGKLALFDWLVRRLAPQRLGLVATFRKLYEEADGPFPCRNAQTCPLADLLGLNKELGEAPACPFVSPQGVERIVLVFEKIKMHGSDALELFKNDRPYPVRGTPSLSDKKFLNELARAIRTLTAVRSEGDFNIEDVAIALLDRAIKIPSEYSQEEDIAEQFADWLREVASDGIYPWELRNAHGLFFDKTQQLVYIPNPVLRLFLAQLGRQNKKGLLVELRRALGKDLVAIDKRPGKPIPVRLGSPQTVRPHMLIIRVEWFRKQDIELEPKETGTIEELPEEGEE